MKMVREFERKLAAAALARDPDLSRFYDTHQLTVEDLDRLGTVRYHRGELPVRGGFARRECTSVELVFP